MTSQDPILDKARPGVYIELVKVGPRKPYHSDESLQGIWLRIHNNTMWELVLPVFSAPEELGDAGVFYEVRALPESSIDTPPTGERRHGIASTEVIPPGKDLVFSIPREHLKAGLAISVQFFFKWEDQSLNSDVSGPEHYVTYTSDALARQERTKH